MLGPPRAHCFGLHQSPGPAHELRVPFPCFSDEETKAQRVQSPNTSLKSMKRPFMDGRQVPRRETSGHQGAAMLELACPVQHFPWWETYISGAPGHCINQQRIA